ncbi:MAG: RES domain-containing protein [Verrucomicrobiota bacterium]
MSVSYAEALTWESPAMGGGALRVKEERGESYSPGGVSRGRKGNSGDGIVRGDAWEGRAGIAVTPLIWSLQSGLPFAELDDIQQNLGIPMEKLVPVLGISKASLHRRKAVGRLDPAESDRVVRLARLLGQAASVMESVDDGRRWLRSPALGLGGAVPLEFQNRGGSARSGEPTGAHRTRGLFLMRQAWRIVKARHAAIALDGEGARRFGGRWNSKGTRLVFSSGSQALAALETLVHLVPPVTFPFVVIPVAFDPVLVERAESSVLPSGWTGEPPPPFMRHIGDRWAAEARSAVLEVPSVLIPTEANYLLYPAHPDFQKIQVSRFLPFSFDPRLL